MPTAVENVARDRKGPYRSRDELRQILEEKLGADYAADAGEHVVDVLSGTRA